MASRLLDVGSAASFCGLQKAPDGAIPLRAMLPFRPFQNECAGVSKRDEFLAALDFDDLGERYRPAIAIPFRHVSQYAVARSVGLLKKWAAIITKARPMTLPRPAVPPCPIPSDL